MAGRRPGRVTQVTQLANLNLQIWYNADVLSATNFGFANSGADVVVTSWKDRSGVGHDLNQSGNASVKPKWITNVKNNLGALRFDGVDESLNINPVSWMQGKPGFTMYVVAKANSNSSYSVVTTTDVDGFKVFQNTTHWGIKTSGATGISNVAVDRNYHIFGLLYDATGATNADKLIFRYDTNQVSLNITGTVANTTSNTSGYFFVGANNGTQFFNGDVAEVVMFTRALKGNELVQVEEYLKGHWGL